MINGVRFKVCGLTSLVDAECADRCGADFLAFNLYPKSPRYLSLDAFNAMTPRLPDRKKVAVSVNPTPSDLAAFEECGFDFFQIHFPHDAPLSTVSAWARMVTPARLWLAPKLPPEASFNEAWLDHADTFLWDTYHAGGFGGSGMTGNWPAFAQRQLAHPEKTWILAGGLNPENIGAALAASKAKFVDVNSGVEVSPGIKDHEKLKAFALALHKATVKDNAAYRA